MNHSLSLEQLYADGIGIGTSNTSVVFSAESSDGDNDALWSAAQSQENLIRFIDTHEQLQRKNTADKIRMFKKISAKYGRSSKSVENWCNIQSREAEEESATDGGDTKTPETVAKKRNIFVRMFSAIAAFFRKMFAAISAKFKSWSDAAKAKKKKTPEEIAEADKKMKNPDDELKKFCTELGYKIYEYDDSKFSKFAEDFNKCAEHLDDVNKDMQKFNNATDIVKYDPSKYSGVLSTLKNMISGIPGIEKDIPTLKSSNAKDRKAFVKALDEMVKGIDFGKDPERYINYFTKLEKIEKDVILPTDVFGSQVSVKFIDEVIGKITSNGNKIIDSMSKASSIVNSIDKQNQADLSSSKVPKDYNGFVETQATMLALTKILSKMHALMGNVQSKVIVLAYKSRSIYK